MSEFLAAERVLEREVVLRVDFDLVDEAGCVWVSTRFRHGGTARRPISGDLVSTYSTAKARDAWAA